MYTDLSCSPSTYHIRHSYCNFLWKHHYEVSNTRHVIKRGFNYFHASWNKVAATCSTILTSPSCLRVELNAPLTFSYRRIRLLLGDLFNLVKQLSHPQLQLTELLLGCYLRVVDRMLSYQDVQVDPLHGEGWSHHIMMVDWTPLQCGHH